jgi:hypothetical protein
MMLLSPKNTRQKVVIRKINGLWGIDKFHGNVIPNFWLKVDVVVVHIGDIPLMHPHSKVDDHVLVQDVIGTSTLWNSKYVKATNA